MGDDGDESCAQPNDPPDSPDDVCEQCGATIATNDWYPVAKGRTPDGSLRLYQFCSEDCKTRWLDEKTEN